MDMNIVSEDTIEQAFDLVENMTDAEFEAFAEEFTGAESSLAGYIFAHEDEFTDNDFDLLAYLAIVVYKAYSLECKRPPMLISSDEVEAAALEQMNYLEAIENASDSEMEALVASAFDSSEQPNLLDFVAHELHVLESEGEIEHESGGALIYPILQLVVDLLHTAFNGTRLEII
jgi:hypothetical protein